MMSFSIVNWDGLTVACLPVWDGGFCGDVSANISVSLSIRFLSSSCVLSVSSSANHLDIYLVFKMQVRKLASLVSLFSFFFLWE